jgi:signal transduction histidine kinase/DNA-binding NarL/FixJ family response regulator
MKPKKLRKKVVMILSVSALSSLLCTLVTGLAIAWLSHTESLQKRLDSAQNIIVSEAPKFVNGLLLSDESGGLQLLEKRLKDHGAFDSVDVKISWDGETNSTLVGFNCKSSKNISTCIDAIHARFVVAYAVSIPNRILGWIVVTGHEGDPLNLAKALYPMIILLFGFAVSASISGVWVWKYITTGIEGALAKISLTMDPHNASSDAVRIPEFEIDEFNVIGRQLQRILDQLEQAKVSTAIAQTTQMLAHDVRKPFSLLRMGLIMLGNAKDPAGVKQVLSRIVPEIDKAVRSVDGMIADVMEVGSPSTTLIQEAVSAESLIEVTLGELIRMNPKSNISFSYDLKHVHMAHVHVQKVGRVFSNIVGNAFQAMRLKGAMWFKTVESDGMLRFCIGNSGSVIPEESLKHLFEAFFTSGKKGGTGLGLAIAQKVVTAHGGKIWCESSKTAEHPEGQVEFYFTLPVATNRRNQSTANLPKHSADVAKLLEMFTEQSEPSLSVDKGELALEDDVLSSHAELGRPLRVLVIDDESIYRGALASFLTRTPELDRALQLTLADGSESALEASGKTNFDLIVTDVDMGSSSLDGFELVRELRRLGSKSLICVHSNRIVAADNKAAIDSGADSFLPKPMARAQFLRVLLQAAESAKSRLFIREVGAAVPAAVEHVKIKPGVLVVDDSEIVLLGWEDELALNSEFHRMKSFEELQEKLVSDPDFLNSLNYVITDMHLDGSFGDGLDVGRLIKSVRQDLPVLLSSDDTFSNSELVGAVDKVIAKMPVNLNRLTQWRTKL